MTLSWELRLQLAAHPLAYPLVRGLARLGPVVRVPGLGVVVNDARLAHAALGDPDTFTKTGPGSPADLWTPVLGPSVLLNMEGPDHRELRRRLAGLFVPSFVDPFVRGALAAPLSSLVGRLRSGAPVELVAVVQELAGAVIAALVGLPPSPAAMRDAYAQGTAMTAMVRLGRPRLTPRQVTLARRTMATLTAPAADAYAAGTDTTVPGRLRALGMPLEQAMGLVAALVLTGTETIVSFLPRLVALLHDHHLLPLPPFASDRASADRASAVIAEGLRVITPSPVMLRSVAAAGRIGDLAVRPGERVIIATISCNRAYGPFDPTREQPPELRRLWFGAGPHVCLGAPLALAETSAVLAVLPPVRVVSRRAARGVLIPGYSSLVLAAA